MSKITKIECDMCHRELPMSEYCFKGHLIFACENATEGELLFDGDYCKDCMNRLCNRILSLL